MRLLIAMSVLLAATETSAVQDLMQQAFYPVLLGILVLASLGLPIPEDIPLIAAGVLLKTHPGIATWTGTLTVALIGIMTGDLVLYALGRWWGPEVVAHRLVRRLITPRGFVRASLKFHRYGVWFCFFGRFLMGVRAVMCMTAGATRFPYWRFFLADLCGAVLSVPFFVYLGYWFWGVIPTLRAYLVGAQGSLAASAAVVVIGAAVYYRYRRGRMRGRKRVPPTAPEAIAVLPELPAASVPIVTPAEKAFEPGPAQPPEPPVPVQVEG